MSFFFLFYRRGEFRDQSRELFVFLFLAGGPKPISTWNLPGQQVPNSGNSVAISFGKCASLIVRYFVVSSEAPTYTPGREEYTPPPWHRSFLGLSPDPEVAQRKAMVKTIFLGNQGKMVCTIGPERRVYTIEASDPEKEKRKKGGFPRWWCIPPFFPDTKMFRGNSSGTF